ncbi:MAG: DNA glycosylase AlkZ-like family protein [Streptosporangiaceae bacterium]
MTETPSLRAVNRALLSRQLLLDRQPLPADELSHADRSRVISAASTKRFYTVNGVIPGSVLIDGFVAGMWRVAESRRTATLTIELFGPPRQRAELLAEAERVLSFCAPDASPDIRFGPLV